MVFALNLQKGIFESNLAMSSYNPLKQDRLNNGFQLCQMSFLAIFISLQKHDLIHGLWCQNST